MCVSGISTAHANWDTQCSSRILGGRSFLGVLFIDSMQQLQKHSYKHNILIKLWRVLITPFMSQLRCTWSRCWLITCRLITCCELAMDRGRVYYSELSSDVYVAINVVWWSVHTCPVDVKIQAADYALSTGCWPGTFLACSGALWKLIPRRFLHLRHRGFIEYKTWQEQCNKTHELVVLESVLSCTAPLRNSDIVFHIFLWR